jgi:hypothetical protein
MIAEDGLRDTHAHEPLDERHDGDAVRAPVDEIADEDEWPRGGALLRVDTQSVQEREQRLDLAMNIADDVDRTRDEGLYQSRHGVDGNTGVGAFRRARV